MDTLIATRIQPLPPGEEKNRDPEHPGKPPKAHHPPAAPSTPPVESGSDEKHEIDERA